MPEDTTRQVSRRNFLVGTGAAGAIALAGCTEQTGNGNGNGNGNGGSSNGSGDLSGDIIVKGSSTVFPISRRLAEEFMADHSGVNITVDSTGSGGGFKNHFCPGDSQLNGASRPIKDSEESQCSDNDVEPVEFEIAGDALTMAVNNNNDDIDCMTFDELSQIWRDDGATTWADVNSDWPDEEIKMFGPATTSGTYDWFNENVVGSDRKHTDEHQPTEDDDKVVQGIEDNANGMGYFGYAYYNSNSDRVKAIKIEQSEGDGCTEPSLANAKDNSYPMARPLFIYATKSSLERDEVYEFMKYYINQSETDTISDIGYVPASTELRDSNLDKLDEMAGR